MDESFFAELPESCDPCGENGEFHSFVYQGPNWLSDVPVSKGEIVLRDSFLFCDLLHNNHIKNPQLSEPDHVST